MGPSAIALLGFAGLTLVLLGMLASLRAVLVFSGARAVNQFRPDGTDVSEFSGRLCRAHANCYENLPVFAAVVLVAMITGNSAITDPLAPWFLAARVGQTAVHLASTGPMAVSVRFGFFLVQYVIVGWMLVGLAATL